MPVARELCNAFKEEVKVIEYLIKDSRDKLDLTCARFTGPYIKTTSARGLTLTGGPQPNAESDQGSPGCIY